MAVTKYKKYKYYQKLVDVKRNMFDSENSVGLKNVCPTCYSIFLVVALFTCSFAALYIYKELFCGGQSSTYIPTHVYTPETIETYLDREQYRDTLVEKVVSCYYNTPIPDALNQLLPNNIHPHLCTHINVAFARVVDKEIALEDIQYKTLVQLQQLKKINPKLKILLSVGGAGNDNGFSEMVIDHASRKVFIKSIKNILKNYTLDGIDLDWEFPALHGTQLALAKRERQHFSQLLQEIRREYVREKRNYLLTVAVAAQQTIVDVSYDVDQLNLYTDFINIMTYDYHFYSKYTPFTGLNSPLFVRSDEQLFLSSLNINFTVHMYLDKGLERNKIVIGIPTYGHTFTLVNADNTKVGSPASGFGSLGSKGFINYPDICSFLASKSNVTVKQDHEAKVPYLYKDLDWVSYDSPQSVIAKAMYIKDYGLRGAMIYSLNADDYNGSCGGDQGEGVKFPLLKSVTNVLSNNTSLENQEKGEY
ncbi:chitotriosidase-1 [Plodia interpunctella]|uniref:chitotriosidase-1 n=1 Tax=Plodia interpunctella TaxID=58824 RepID=UPI002367BD0A|nr:chitotriosidase-1 [Plodia interpunctella]